MVRAIELGRNTGFAHAVNAGIDAAQTPYVALLNSDTAVHSGWLEALVTCIERAPLEIAAVTSQMLMMDDPGLIDDAGDELSWYGAATKRGHARSARDFDNACEIFSPCAGASLYRRTFLEAAGGFDEDFFAYLEDVDLGLRGRLLGYRYLYEPRARVQHKGHGSRIPRTNYVELMTRNRLLLFCKNVPLPVLLGHVPQILFGQIHFLIVYGRPWSSLKGYASFVTMLPAVFRKRREIARTMTLDRAAVPALLGNTSPQPSLFSSVYPRCTKLFHVRAKA